MTVLSKLLSGQFSNIVSSLISDSHTKVSVKRESTNAKLKREASAGKAKREPSQPVKPKRNSKKKKAAVQLPSLKCVIESTITLLAASSIPLAWNMTILPADSLWRSYFVSTWPLVQLAVGVLFMVLLHGCNIKKDSEGNVRDKNEVEVDKLLLLMAALTGFSAFEMFGLDVQSKRYSAFHSFRMMFGCEPAHVHEHGLLLETGIDHYCPLDQDFIAWVPFSFSFQSYFLKKY